MLPKPGTNAYIDAANLHKGVLSLGWRLDYRRFRVWLSDKYGVAAAYLFIGRLSRNAYLYAELWRAGYQLVFKDVTYDSHGNPKGNCDADLVVRVMMDCYEGRCDNAVMVASDGDYASLVAFLLSRNFLRVVISPANVGRCSILLKKTGAPITFLNDVRPLVQKRDDNEKAPGADETALGSFS